MSYNHCQDEHAANELLYLAMQESNSNTGHQITFNKVDNNQNNQEENLESLKEQCNRSGRRNALTPESSEHIEPIRQTEIQERMSNLAVSSTESDAGHSSGSQCGG